MGPLRIEEKQNEAFHRNDKKSFCRDQTAPGILLTNLMGDS